MPQFDDYQEWAQLREESRAHLQPFEPKWHENEHSRLSYRRYLRHIRRQYLDKTGFSLFIFIKDDKKYEEKLVGGLTLSNIRHSIIGSGDLGYWLGKTFTGNGYMTNALCQLSEYAFSTLRLHRLQAAVIVHNQPSIRLLERVGFSCEGLARDYLKVNGKWQDHKLYALLETDKRLKL